MTLIDLQQVSKTYQGRRGEVRALDAVTLQIPEGEFLAVRGPSGSGKSTLLLTLAGMIRPTAGSVVIGGQDLYQLSGPARANYRARNVGFVFQMFHLVPYLTVLENVLLPTRLVQMPGSEARERALSLLERMGMTPRAHHRPSELSTGERQRTAIARAVINQPWLLLADEPTGNLDTDTGQQIMDYLAEYQQAGHTVVVVTHDPAVEARAARRVQLRAGRIDSA
ncbi:MAG: ABC transporter ATP-binding protein [Armatimonadia bacterium]